MESSTTSASDKRRISEKQARQATFNYIRAIAPIDEFDQINFEQVTCVVVLAFTQTRNLVTVRLERGLDIPGGHVQTHETSIEQVARRETLEEAAITLDRLYVTGIIESNYFGSQPEDLTYIIVVSSFVKEIHPFIANPEALERLIIPPSDFLQEYRVSNPQMMRHMLEDAQAYLFNDKT